MRWYLNDTSLQAQFDPAGFEGWLRSILRMRGQAENFRNALFVSRSFQQRLATPAQTVRQVVQRTANADFRRLVLSWLDRSGPFSEDDRLTEQHDFFEIFGIDVTNEGLGEAARRVKAGVEVSTISLQGGPISFEHTPLKVQHGLAEDRLGEVSIANTWATEHLQQWIDASLGLPKNWKSLVEIARVKFPKLLLPDALYQNSLLSREPFDGVIRDRIMVLLCHLNAYVAGRGERGVDSPRSRQIVEDHFTGGRAAFSGESLSNQRDFKADMTFPDPRGSRDSIFAHWHGKVSHRSFRMHFEWPLDADADQLLIVYIGPKITKD